MKVIDVRNVHQALPEACYQIKEHGLIRKSRNGTVSVLPEPLATVYREPTERVLFWAQRNANPFFHLFESIWMLQCRNDVAFIAQFNKHMVSFSDDGETFAGAYGHRWGVHFGINQLKMIADALKLNPDCRRQVLTMWDPKKDLGSNGKDLPCNTQVYFQRDQQGSLDMMVTNRSNDAIWGAYGANAVHFSFLQEYMAGLIRCPVGRYTQVSMNTHIYHEPHLRLMNEMAALAPQPPDERVCPYSAGHTRPIPIMSLSHGRWWRELDTFFKNGHADGLEDPFIFGVLYPMSAAWTNFKTDSFNRYDMALDTAKHIIAPDWHMACVEWLTRRKEASLES